MGGSLCSHVATELLAFGWVVFEVLVKRLTTSVAETTELLVGVRRILGANLAEIEGRFGEMVKHYLHPTSHHGIKIPNRRGRAMFKFAILGFRQKARADDGVANKMLQSVFIQIDLFGEIGVADGAILGHIVGNFQLAKGLKNTSLRTLQYISGVSKIKNVSKDHTL